MIMLRTYFCVDNNNNCNNNNNNNNKMRGNTDQWAESKMAVFLQLYQQRIKGGSVGKEDKERNFRTILYAC